MYSINFFLSESHTFKAKANSLIFKDVLKSKDGNLVVKDELELLMKGYSVYGVYPVGKVHTQ